MNQSQKLFIVAALAIAAVVTRSQADLASGYTMQSLPVATEGQFTAYNGNIHYWTGADGYQIYNVAGGTTTAIGKPPGGVLGNGFGDAFGVLDRASGRFYAATYNDFSSSYVYTYDTGSGSWLTTGPSGVFMVNAYGGQVHNSQLYVSGLAEPWNGTYGQANFIFAFDHSATPGGTPRHDTLIETAGNSAYLTLAPNGDVYYGTFSDNTLYRWTASQVAGVTQDLYAPGAVDTFLTLANAADSWALPGAGNGVAVDDAGHVFFTVNNFPNHSLGMLDSSQPSGYREIYTTEDFATWFGPISVDGDFLNGDTLYMSPFGSIIAINAVPEPSTMGLLALGGLSLLLRRRSRK